MQLTENTVQNELIIKHAAKVLRSVAEGKTFSFMYYWSVTHAIEALRDSDQNAARIYLDEANRNEPK